jgi:trans-2,3-dihydro-3-hydroxyanthranilate isomerase
MPRSFNFVQYDVFTSKPLEGNQLAIFPDARGLADDEMQALAREMNFCETTFIVPRDSAMERERGHRVRIFTIREELPFAGHPTLGTATYLHTQTGANEIVLDLNVGRVPVSFEGEFGEMQQRDPEFGTIHARDEVASALGMNVDDFDPSLPIQSVSTGLPFAITPLRSLEVARRLNVDPARSTAYLARHEAKFFYFVTRETVDSEARLHARMIFYGGEDPATGSAGGCCCSWMVKHGVIAPNERVLIEQGVEMQRPSRIYVRGDKDGDRVINVRVGGHSVLVARGEVLI